MALGTVTVGSASKFHAERSGREIQGSHGDQFHALFAFNFDRQFLANNFPSPTPGGKANPPLVPPTSHPTPKSTPFVQTVSPKNDQTAADIHRFLESMSTTSFF